MENKKGIEAYQQGKIDEAKKDFGSAQAVDPSLPELEFNRGTVEMKAGDADSAIAAFNKSARGAIERKDGKLASKSLYNLGGALTKKGDVKAAIRSYLSAMNAMKADPTAQNDELESNIRKNLELLQKEQEKKKQEQKDNKDKKQDQQDKKDQQQSQDQQSQAGNNKQDQKDQQNKPDKKDGDKNQQQNQNQPYKDDSKERKQQGFKSKKLSADDADRVMAELQNKERELQEKLKKQQNGTGQYHQKDW